MQVVKGWRGPVAWAMVWMLALTVVSALGVGCGKTQYQERNAALSTEYESAYQRNQELEARVALLEARLAAKPAAPAYVAPQPASYTPSKPDFGPGTEVTQTPGATTVTVSDQVLFASGSATLKPESRSVLDNVARVLNRDYPNDLIRIEGHSDNEPIRKTKNLWKDNWELSRARADAVSRYLASKGISAGRIQTSGFADTRPVASNTSLAGRAKNRRVEIVVLTR